jgi:hypothetical protein
MKVECCGKVRESPFCPICGKRLMNADLPLIELLTYCRHSEQRLRKTVETWNRKAGEETDTSFGESYARDASKLSLTVERWKRWGDALADILAKVDET